MAGDSGGDEKSVGAREGGVTGGFIYHFGTMVAMNVE
jgi:hypothetical protein